MDEARWVQNAAPDIGLVPSSNESSFALKVFHFNIKDHMTWYFLITDGRGLTIGEDLKSLSNLFHFLGNDISL